MKTMTLLLLCVGVVGCSNQHNTVNQNAQANEALQADRVICKKRITTGSNMLSKTCKTQAQILRDRQIAQESIRRLRRSGHAGAGEGASLDGRK